jgi:7-cyano-7-deazaguanine synthase
MDSTTALAMAVKDCDRVVAVSFQYGSKHNAVEHEAMQAVARHYRVRYETWELPPFFSGGESALLGESNMPALTYQQIHDTEGPSPTVVPFRNPVMISIAVARAVIHKCDLVYVGVHGEDAHNFAYPDCTNDCLGPLAGAVYAGTYNKVHLVVPFQWMSKADIVWCARKLCVPLHLTWSCYNPVMPPYDPNYGTPVPLQCGECPTCVERIEAFKANGYTDPVGYAKPIDWGDTIGYGYY